MSFLLLAIILISLAARVFLPLFSIRPLKPTFPPEGSLHSQLAESCQKRNITTIADVEMLIPSLVCPDYHSASFAAPGSCCPIYPPMLKPASVHMNMHYTLHIWKYLSVLLIIWARTSQACCQASVVGGVVNVCKSGLFCSFLMMQVDWNPIEVHSGQHQCWSKPSFSHQGSCFVLLWFTRHRIHKKTH